MRHLSCVRWSTTGAALAIAATAYAQEGAPVPPSGDPATDLLLRIAGTLGLPGIVAWVAWQLRGLLTAGITVRLSDEDRELLRKPKE
jgi:hypothetical protein